MRFKAVVLLIIILFSVFSVSNPFVNTSVHAQEALDPTVISDLALPAVVFIMTIIQAEMEVPIPDREMKPTSDFIIVPAQAGGVGSGFFVNNDGYIVTNGHVVYSFTHPNPRDDLIVKQSLAINAAEVIIQSLKNASVQLTQDMQQMLIEYVVKYARLRNFIRDVYVLLGESTGGRIMEKSIKARIVGNPSPFLERDIAVIKIDRTPTPSLPLGSSDNLQVGETVYAFGYPGVVNLHMALSKETQLAPSMTMGIVSAFRQTKSDTPAVQTDADITKGNSGGPVLNNKGEVVGVVNMGSINELGLQVAGFNFFIPINTVKQFLTELGIQYNTGGAIDKLWREGVGYFYAGLYNRAKEIFQEVSTLYPFNWYAKVMIQKAQEKIVAGNKVNAEIDINVNVTEVTKGEAIEVTGSIMFTGNNPLDIEVSFAGQEVKIVYVVGDVRDEFTVEVGEDNTFKHVYVPDASGDLTVKVEWEGDEDFNPADASLNVVVNDPPMPFYLFLIPLLLVGGAAAYFLMRKRGAPVPQPSVTTVGANVCPSCGHVNKADAKFCVKCGTRLVMDNE